jgi:protein ImuB
MRRVISLWLPSFPTDRLSRRGQQSATRRDAPAEALVTVRAHQGSERVACPSVQARAAGIAPEMTLADARALLPSLRVRPADPDGDARALIQLADWCTRYTPWTAVDPSGGESAGGLMLDVSGCAHLFGGEAALLEDLLTRLRGLGFACRAGLADTPGAAWAVARFEAGSAKAGAIAPPGGARAALAALPARALRLAPATAEGLARLGLRLIGDLYPLPRAGLARRFGAAVGQRLDQALGRAREPISPRRPVARWHARLAFAEPVARLDDVAAGTRDLLDELCRLLERSHRGARRLELALYLSDGAVRRLRIGTSRPTRAPDHLSGLLAEHLAALDLGADQGTGVEAMVLAAPVTDPLTALQLSLTPGHERGGGETGLAELVDRLGNRLGRANVARLAARQSHLPERASRAVPPLGGARDGGDENAWPTGRDRPLRLLARPEAVEAVAEVPDGPPVLFRWRRVVHRVARAYGPERIAPEWWRAEAREIATRDYFRVEDSHGRRFWLYRDGLYQPRHNIRGSDIGAGIGRVSDPPLHDIRGSGDHDVGAGFKPALPAPEPRWYLHGIFA